MFRVEPQPGLEFGWFPSYKQAPKLSVESRGKEEHLRVSALGCVWLRLRTNSIQ